MGESIPTTLDFNILLDEVESGSSGSVGNLIRKLREHEVAAYNAGVGGPTGELVATFVTALDQRANERMSDIETTCSRNMGSLIDSFRELLSIQKETVTLGANLNHVNTKLGGAVTKYTKSCEELSNCAATLGHVDQCIEALHDVLPILEQYSHIEEYEANNQQYHALKALENLEFNHLAKIRPYAFSKIIIHRIPKLRASIKEVSFTELTDFLERIRTLSCRLGVLVMSDVAASSGMDDMLAQLSLAEDADAGATNTSSVIEGRSVPAKTLTSSQSNETTASMSQLPLRRLATDSRLSSGLQAELDELTELAAGSASPEQPVVNTPTGDYFGKSRQRIEDLIDFGPVYRSLHINLALDEQSGFVRHYCAQRQRQCQLMLGLTPEQQATLRKYGEFFCSICGFFVVEDYLRHHLPSTNSKFWAASFTGGTGDSSASARSPGGQATLSSTGTVTNARVYYQTYLDELWSLTVQRLVEFANNNARDCKSAEELFNLKEFVLLFNRTMQSLGFNTTGSTEMISCVQRCYKKFLIRQMKESFEMILHHDDFAPICVNDSNEFSRLVKLYPPCNTEEFADLPYPRHLSYSKMVPKIYSVIRHQIDVSHMFFANREAAHNEVEDSMNRTINAMFKDCLYPILNRYIREYENNLLRQTQLCANIEELESACGHLDVYVQQSYHSQTDSASDRIQQNSCSLSDGTTDSLKDRLDLLPISLQPKGLPSGANHVRSRLRGASLLKDLRALVESLIYSHLDKCVYHFTSMINYSPTKNNQVEEVNPQNIKPTEHILDLITWLSATFSSAFANMPPKVTQTACLSVCKFVARSMQDRLIGPSVEKLTYLSVLQASVDLSKCEEFARSQPVPGLDGNMLLLIFADARQLIDLYLRDAWEVYLSDRDGSNGNLYDRVQPSAAIRLIELLQASDRRSGGLFSMRRNESDKSSKLSSIIRQLHNKQKHR